MDNAIDLTNMKKRLLIRNNKMLWAGTTCAELKHSFLRSNIRNEFMDIVYILSGDGYFIDEQRNRQELKAGDLLIRVPGQLHHQYRKKGLYVDKFVTLPPEFFRLFVENHLLSATKTNIIHVGLHQWIVQQYDELYRQLERSDDFNYLPVMLNIAKFCMELLIPRATPQIHSEQITEAIRMLNNDSACTLSMKDVARKIHISYANFRRLFTLYRGVSPQEFRQRLRMDRIQTELLSSDVSLKELAIRYGFADIYTFSRQFKKYVGCAPAQFRKQAFEISKDLSFE